MTEGWTRVPLTITTAAGVSMNIEYLTPGIGWPGDEGYDGLAGVREPRRPDDTPPCLVAAREPDGSWCVPVIIRSAVSDSERSDWSGRIPTRYPLR